MSILLSSIFRQLPVGANAALASLVALVTTAAGCGDSPSSKPEVGSAVQGVTKSIVIDQARDTSVSETEPGRSFGTSRFLRVRKMGRQRTLIAFNSEEIRQKAWTGELVSATVDLTIAATPKNWGPSGGTVSLYALTQPWGDWGATWSCSDDPMPDNDADDCDSASAWPMDGADVSWDPVPVATAHIQNGQTGTLSFDVSASIADVLAGSDSYGWILMRDGEVPGSAPPDTGGGPVSGAGGGQEVDTSAPIPCIYGDTPADIPAACLTLVPEGPPANTDLVLQSWENEDGPKLTILINSDVSLVLGTPTYLGYRYFDRDNRVSQGSQSTEYGTSAYVMARQYSGDINRGVVYVSTSNIQSLLGTNQLAKAELSFSIASSTPSPVNNYIAVHQMLKTWSETTSNWVTAYISRFNGAKIAWDMLYGNSTYNTSYITNPSSLTKVTSSTSITLDVTSDVQRILNGGANYGWLLRAYYSNGVWLYSRNASYSFQRPRLKLYAQCVQDTDAQICTANGWECGTRSVTDNCGDSRTVDCTAALGGCTAPETTCGGGAGGGTPNMCGCTPESNADFCTSQGAECGSLSATDNCGAPRTVDCTVELGDCTAPETCGALTANQCDCLPETDAQFCASAGAECGSVSGDDNCNLPRIADCDAVPGGGCTVPETCGYSAPNLCDTDNILYEDMTYTDSSEIDTHTVFRAGLPTREFTYEYDKQHQLISAVDNLVAEATHYSVAFDYTAAGRINNVGAPSGGILSGRDPFDYTYGDGFLAGADKHAPVTLTGSFKNVGYGYDHFANVTTRTETLDPQGPTPITTQWDFTYDGTDQQREVLLDTGGGPGSGGRELYYYDGSGARYMALTYDTWDPDPLSPHQNPSRIRIWNGGAEVWYVPNGAGDAMEVQSEYAHVGFARIKTTDRDPANPLVATTEVEGSFQNGLGHMMGAFNLDTGVMSAAYVYGPYGEILESVGAEQEDHLQRFNGKEADLLSKLSYYGYRYYDELSLSWTQADPLYRVVPDLAGANPRAATLYAFSMNNPVRYMDPDGLQSTATTRTTSSGPEIDIECPPGLGDCGYKSAEITDVSGDQEYDSDELNNGANALTKKAMRSANAAWYSGGEKKGGIRTRHQRTEFAGGYWSSFKSRVSRGWNWCKGNKVKCGGVAAGSLAVGWFAGPLVAGVAGGSAAVVAGNAAPVVVATAAQSERLVLVTRWGRQGLQSGDWIMKGGNTWVNYVLSFKWEPAWLNGNLPAARATAQSFFVRASEIVNPYSEGPVANAVKWLWRQKQYKP